MITAVLLETKVLAPLAGWYPVGSKLEALVLAARGHGPMADHDLIALRAWARRWTLLPEPLRAFYVRHLDDQRETARVVLWRYLSGETPEEWQINVLRRLWLDETGLQPLTVDFCPKR